MPTFEKGDGSIHQLAKDLLSKYDEHKVLLAAMVKIDFVFAFSDKDSETGRPLNDALTQNGRRALGITRKVPLKDRVLGRGDAEIALDGDHWTSANAEEQAALLDHELHHIALKTDKHGNIQYDDAGRPQITLRKHDIQVGWFNVIAERHGDFSTERIQARQIMDNAGQYFWPEIAPRVTITAGDQSVTVPMGVFSKAAAKKI